MSHWHIRILSKINGTSHILIDASTPSIPYYIPLMMVPIITFMVICFLSKRSIFNHFTACKKVTKSEHTHSKSTLTWTHRKVSFAFMPMRLWDTGNDQTRIQETVNVLQNVEVPKTIKFQQNHEDRLAGPCKFTESRSGKHNGNVRSGALYDKVVLELKQSFWNDSRPNLQLQHFCCISNKIVPLENLEWCKPSCVVAVSLTYPRRVFVSWHESAGVVLPRLLANQAAAGAAADLAVDSVKAARAAGDALKKLMALKKSESMWLSTKTELSA